MKRRSLMSSSMVDVFQSFLKESINGEVVIVNTNFGMEVYYCSDHDYSNFIRESILLYTINLVDHTKLKFRNNLDKEAVYKSFYEALETFVQYPQIFLAYTKKFIHLRKKNKSSRYVMPILSEYFERIFNTLAKAGKIPHYNTIEKAKSKSEYSKNEGNAIEDLISEILLKKHSN
ncbi:hypothetical protein [Aquimarina sp. 2201CG5-10]|uniref:hypothetical protein n=1 Tax=Aquimarina callyspongiae TaxID=3098150 RepID=UPI002AB38E8D|nr:hypothetical protein [Aquimarina sp. 2201CG5-10]MDY8136755.1 hypothetical protein [Aquimarina sp. 2201CG5-10]